MFGNNPKRSIVTSSSPLSYFVKEIFKTIQGEGVYVGMTSVFLRLGGCNLACSFCDTDFEDFYQMLACDIVDKIHQLSQNEQGDKIVKLVVITGGEPFRQDIAPLCKMLLDQNYLVQIETNGTIFRDIHLDVYITCSPKAHRQKYIKLDPRMIERANSLKFIISTNLKPYNTLPSWINDFQGEVFLQPMDQYDQKQNLLNRNLTVEMALSNNYRISLQIHKIINVR